MVRVPTYATYMNMVNNTQKNKEMLDLYTFQSITGLKSQSYAGYGMSAYSIVSLEAALKVNNNYMENNKILSTEVKTADTALSAVDKSIREFKSLLTSFSGMDLKSISPDQTGGELKFTNSDPATYNNQTITVNGKTYTFTTAAAPTADQIGINGLTTAEDIMQATANKINADFPNTMTYDTDKAALTFDMYTINGYSSVLNATGVETGKPHEMSQEQQVILKQLQSLAFTTMKVLTDTLNVSANGKYLFGGGVSTEPPVNFPFSTLEEFQKYYDGISIKYPSNEASDLANRNTTNRQTGGLNISYAGGNTDRATITADNTGGFLKDNVSANPQTTGQLVFNADTQSINASVSGAFNTYQAGDLMVIEGTAGNNGVYVVKSVSADGKTVKLEPQTGTNPITDENFDTAANPDTVQFKSSFPLNSVLDLNGMDAYGIKTQGVQVTGVSADGRELYIKVNPATFPTAPVGGFNIPDSTRWDISAESYYKGGNLTSQKIVSDNQSISFDITASDPAFEKMFRALGEIAQGNLVDLRSLSEPMIGVKNVGDTEKRVTEALDLIQKSLFDAGSNNNVKNADFYTIQSKINSNMVILQSVSETQTAMKLNLENNVSSLKDVNKEEAAVLALLASNQLAASYAAMQNAMSVSLLNYLK